MQRLSWYVDMSLYGMRGALSRSSKLALAWRERTNINDAGIRSEDIPLNPLMEKASGESHFCPSSVFVFEQEVEKYPRKCQRKWRPAEIKAGVPMVKSNGWHLAPVCFFCKVPCEESSALGVTWTTDVTLQGLKFFRQQAFGQLIQVWWWRG